jgi:hypothetical protein
MMQAVAIAATALAAWIAITVSKVSLGVPPFLVWRETGLTVPGYLQRLLPPAAGRARSNPREDHGEIHHIDRVRRSPLDRGT